MRDLQKLRSLVARRLKLARNNAGLTQQQVAKLSGVPRPSLSEAEAGRRRVSAEELRVLSELYGVAISWLTGERAESADPAQDRIELAARELAKLRDEDVDRLLILLSAMKTEGK